jgi:ATP-binding cassette subfamily F protein uup
LNDVSVAFGGPPLLERINLQIEAGDRLCLLGRNGSGKSTLLKLLAGHLQADAGDIHRQQGLKVALVDQEIPLDLAGTVFDVTASGLGEATALLASYHEVSHRLAEEGGEYLLERLSLLQKRLEDTGGWGLNDDVGRVLKRLQLDPDAPFASLSGGSKRRVLLARALVTSPDILLLDEPTNHLDMETILWLEEFLPRQVPTCIFVTHDRAFARRLATRVAELDRGRLYSFSCSYDDFMGRREELLAAEAIRQALFDRKLSEEEAWIRKGIKARRTRNEGRVRALKALRQERLRRRERLGSVRLQLQEAQRSGTLVAEAEGVSFAYGERVIVRDLNTIITRGDRIGIVGPNGAGKTTLLRLLLGELEPQTGQVVLGTRRDLVYVDQLRQQLDLEKTVQENVAEGNDTLLINGTQRHVIGYLQDFLFSPERARTPVRILSGGERSRLLLAKLFARPCNILVLDEPTNDLDVETLELLEELLMDFSGTVLLVSHDREFLDNVVTSTLVMAGDGTVREYVGGYGDWLRQTGAEAAAAAAPERPAARSGERSDGGKGVAAPPRPRTLSYKEARELEALPQRIALLEEEQGGLHGRLADPEFYRSAGAEVAVVNARLQELEQELLAAYGRWEELEELSASR